MMKQKEGVFAAITVGMEQGLEGDALKTFAVEQVKVGLMTGEIGHSKGPIADEKAARSYAVGLVNNWMKKDERLTGGAKYVPQTKRGPRVKDEELLKLTTSLKSLEAHGADQGLIDTVKARIEARRQVLAQEKATSKVQSLDETLAELEALGITA